MREFGHLNAVRLAIDKTLATEGELPPDGIRVSAPQNNWHVAILHESAVLFQLVRDKTQLVVQQFETDIRTREQTAGRAIDPSFPVQMSRAVIEVAEIIEDAERHLDAFTEAFDTYSDRASFGANTTYEDAARSHLKVSRRLVERTRLFLHAYLWILWAIEGLEQANQFGGVLSRQDRSPARGEELFDYIAHPSLAVATLSCTAMIEEVGAVYINKYTSKSIKPDNTSCSRVLNLLEEEYPDIGEFDVAAIREHAKETRTDVAHYITKRGSTVTFEEFPEYYSGIWEGIALGRQLVTFLLADLLEKHQQIPDPFST